MESLHRLTLDTQLTRLSMVVDVFGKVPHVFVGRKVVAEVDIDHIDVQ